MLNLKTTTKIWEYHIDTHPIFKTYPKTLSFWRDLGITRPLMTIGQDETVFKQYSFGWKCWMGPSGETQLLLKSDGYSRMVSGFVSREFGVGLHLTKIELDEVNQSRTSDEWEFYLSTNDTNIVYRIVKKKKLYDKLILIRFLTWVSTWRTSGITIGYPSRLKMFSMSSQ